MSAVWASASCDKPFRRRNARNTSPTACSGSNAAPSKSKTLDFKQASRARLHKILGKVYEAGYSCAGRKPHAKSITNRKQTMRKLRFVGIAVLSVLLGACGSPSAISVPP
jgi:hypothetical protein